MIASFGADSCWPFLFAAIPLIGVSLCIWVSLIISKELYDMEKRRDPDHGSECITDPHVRMILPDFDLMAVMMIERLCFQADRQWDAAAFREHLGIGCGIAVYENARAGVIGYAVFFAADRQRVEIIRFAVQPAAQRCGIGTSLLKRVFVIAAGCDVESIDCDVSEDCLSGQMLLKSLGFRYQKTLEEDLRDVPDIDMYRFSMTTETCCPTSCGS